MFYQSLDLFGSQQASDRVIERVVVLLGCKDRLELGIVASPRGLVAGDLTIIPPTTPPVAAVAAAADASTSAMSSSSSSDGGSVRRERMIRCQIGFPSLIPTEISPEGGWSVVVHCRSSASASSCCDSEHLVIVVEKEAVFKSLLQHQQQASASAEAAAAVSTSGIDWRKVILVTGKGYPDNATRTLVRMLATRAGPVTCEKGAQIRLLGLFDFDPYGIDIYRQYTLGCVQAANSTMNSITTGSAPAATATDALQWIGVELADFLPNFFTSTPAAISNGSMCDGDDNVDGRDYPLVQLRNDERSKAVVLLRGFRGQEREVESLCR